MSSLQPVRAESLSAQVAESIREAIFSGELKPGQVLRELGLAKNMNVSQATVREALSHLEHYGLVVRTPNRSTSVTSLAPDEVLNRTRVWLTLEGKIWEEAVNAPQELLIDLSAVVAEMETWGTDARRFHTRLWESAGNSVLLRILDQLTTPLFAFCRIDKEQTPHSIARYKRMLDGIRSGTPNASIQALREQVEALQPSQPVGTPEQLEGREASASA
ncbi:MAG: GntR family transcriptional regulator [Bryobacterales bacterium]|nr:GntR family transcriptional regulator [Bryobacterales bacterium]